MPRRTLASWLWIGQTLALLGAAVGQPIEPSSPPPGPTEALVQSLDTEALQYLAEEVLERNHTLARARHLAVAAAVRAPQVRALPDPVVALDLFVLPPESRVGPQRLSASIQQKLPWFGKLELEEQVALFDAATAEAEVEVRRLDTLLETRRLAYELAFHHLHRSIVDAERQTLERYETAAQAHYAAGTGLQQEIVRIQAQITSIDMRLLEIEEHRAHMQAALNGLRDRPADTPVETSQLPEAREPHLDRVQLREIAHRHRPELVAADARIAARRSMIELAEKNRRPDLTLGLSYTLVTGREDGPGRLAPPPDDSDDILALNGSMNLPIRKGKLTAQVLEAQALQRAAEEDREQLLTQIEASIGDLAVRIPLLYRHHHLLETVLIKQAREALRSAETAYSTGKLNAMDLLDSEVILFEVRLAALRTRTDLALAWAELERAVAWPLSSEHIPSGTQEESYSNSPGSGAKRRHPGAGQPQPGHPGTTIDPSEVEVQESRTPEGSKSNSPGSGAKRRHPGSGTPR